MMIEGLDGLLEGRDAPGLTELRALLEDLIAGRGVAARLTGQELLQQRPLRVCRLRFLVGGETRAVVIKELAPEVARLVELVASRWLPALGLGEAGPPLLGGAAARDGSCVWHVYDDLGPWELNALQPERDRVRAAVELIGRVHVRFAGHHLLGEIRQHGGDRGLHFYQSNVCDASHALRGWRPDAGGRALRDRLLARLRRLEEETPRRTRALAGLDLPETLVHGDLWGTNILVQPAADGPRARLIDWDRAAVSPATYDLSTLLLRFPAEHRPWVLDLYREAVAPAGWRLPSGPELDLALETHEQARIANRLIWPALALAMDEASWGAEALAEIEGWFEDLGRAGLERRAVPALDRAAP